MQTALDRQRDTQARGPSASSAREELATPSQPHQHLCLPTGLWHLPWYRDRWPQWTLSEDRAHRARGPCSLMHHSHGPCVSVSKLTGALGRVSATEGLLTEGAARRRSRLSGRGKKEGGWSWAQFRSPRLARISLASPASSPPLGQPHLHHTDGLPGHVITRVDEEGEQQDEASVPAGKGGRPG